MDKYIQDEHIHDGHRSRMRAKLIAHGKDIFDTYELLEMLLYYVVPYKDTNPIAKRLIYAFGGLEGVFRARREELLLVSGVGECVAEYLLKVSELSSVIGSEMLPDNQFFTDYDSVGIFWTRYFYGISENRVSAMFFDNNMRLITVEDIAVGIDYESGGVKPKSFLDAAIKNHASVVITAHNHPYGIAYPSLGDRATNEMVCAAFSAVNILHVEHYIVAGEHYRGIMQKLLNRFSQSAALEGFFDKASRNDDFVNGEKVRAETNRYNENDFDYFASLLEPSLKDNTGRVCDSLLKKYQTIENCINADAEELSDSVGESCAVLLKLLAYVTSRRVTERFRFGTNYNMAEIVDYLKAVFLGCSVENVYVIPRDDGGRVLSCELVSTGTVNSSDVLPRKLLEKLVKSGASSLILAHNHPFGNTTPSKEDLSLTAYIDELLSGIGVSFEAHLIVAGQRCEIIEPIKVGK